MNTPEKKIHIYGILVSSTSSYTYSDQNCKFFCGLDFVREYYQINDLKNEYCYVFPNHYELESLDENSICFDCLKHFHFLKYHNLLKWDRNYTLGNIKSYLKNILVRRSPLDLDNLKNITRKLKEIHWSGYY
jgi:hypothetical protein